MVIATAASRGTASAGNVRLTVPDLPIKSAARAAEDEFMLMELERAVAEWTISLSQVMDEERSRTPQGPGLLPTWCLKVLLNVEPSPCQRATRFSKCPPESCFSSHTCSEELSAQCSSTVHNIGIWLQQFQDDFAGRGRSGQQGHQQSSLLWYTTRRAGTSAQRTNSISLHT